MSDFGRLHWSHDINLLLISVYGRLLFCKQAIDGALRTTAYENGASD